MKRGRFPNKRAYNFRLRKQELYFRKEKEAKGLVKPRDHIGNRKSYVVDIAACRKYVDELTDDYLCYAELARKFDLRHRNGHTPRNGGQIIHGLLEEDGCDLSRFNKKRRKTLIFRKKKRRY